MTRRKKSAARKGSAATTAVTTMRKRTPASRQTSRPPTDPAFGLLVGELTTLLGASLVAYLGRVLETRAVRQWIDAQRSPSEITKVRLFNALAVARLFKEYRVSEIAPTWFLGMNAALDDRSPAETLRAATTRDKLSDASRLVKAAAKAFLTS
jgi:hypothetical protein